jgi:pimeloyl-ACP methyl ester carboxylesterase
VLAVFCFCPAAANPVRQELRLMKAADAAAGGDGWRSGFFTTDDDVRIHFEEYGEGGKTILGVHGFLGSGAMYKETFGYIKGDYRFVIYDERAHGKSDTSKEGYTMARYAQDLHKLIKHLNLKNIIVIGYSMGTRIVWEYIKQYGDGDFDKIICTVQSPKMYNDETYKLGAQGVDLRTVFDRIALYNSSYTSAVKGQLESLLSSKDFPTMPQAYQDFYERAATYEPGAMTRLLIGMYSTDYWDVLPTITKPVLFVAAEKDRNPLASAEKQKSLVKGESSLVVIPDYGHLFVFDVPERYAAEIEKFIGGV